jgi:hypothetical protein
MCVGGGVWCVVGCGGVYVCVCVCGLVLWVGQK